MDFISVKQASDALFRQQATYAVFTYPFIPVLTAILEFWQSAFSHRSISTALSAKLRLWKGYGRRNK